MRNLNELANEVIKISGKYTPISQILLFDYTDFENIGNNQTPELIIDTIAGDNIDKTMAWSEESVGDY